MEKIKDNRYLVIAIIVTALFFIIFSYLETVLAASNILIFDNMLTYTPALFYDTVSILNSTPSITYFIFRVLDTIFPFAYGFVLYKLLSNQSNSRLKYLPVVVVFLDLLENIFMIFLIYILNTSSATPVYILNVLTISKFTMILIIVIIIIYRLIRLSRFLNRDEE